MKHWEVCTHLYVWYVFLGMDFSLVYSWKMSSENEIEIKVQGLLVKNAVPLSPMHFCISFCSALVHDWGRKLLCAWLNKQSSRFSSFWTKRRLVRVTRFCLESSQFKSYFYYLHYLVSSMVNCKGFSQTIIVHFNRRKISHCKSWMAAI
jgi:hypothetical protein